MELNNRSRKKKSNLLANQETWSQHLSFCSLIWNFLDNLKQVLEGEQSQSPLLLCGHQWEKKRKGELALTGALSLGPNDCALETTTSQSQQHEREKPNGKVHGRCPPCLLASPQLDGCPEPESPPLQWQIKV